MGWIIAFGLGGLSLLALYISGKCSRMALEICGAAVLVALAGYGWQGKPDMAGQVGAEAPVVPPVQPETSLR